LLLLRLRVRAHEREDPVREVAVGGPDLGARDDEEVAVAHRARLERGEVGARVGLGVALAPADLAAADARQVPAPLLVAAEAQERRADHAEAEARERRREAQAAHLLGEDLRLVRGEAAAAELARPGRRREAARRRALEPGLHLGVVPAR